MDATLDSEDIALLNQLSDKQKDYALTLYTAREKKKSTAYILWILFGVYYFYLGHPLQKHPSLAPLLLFHRRNLVDRGPLPHVRHGEAEK